MKRLSALTRMVSIAVVIGLAGCATEPLPDFRYFRLAPAPTLPPLAQPALDLPVVVEPLLASGVMGERPILYATSASTVRLSQYHYQLWNDPPPAIVRARLLDRLTEQKISKLVTNRLTTRTRAYRISGTIQEFQRIRDEQTGDAVVVTLRLRVERDAGAPLLEHEYRAQLAVSDRSIEAAVAVFGDAIDQIALELSGDLQALKQ